MHKLFDQGLITVTPEYRAKVSPAIRERFENGRDYYARTKTPTSASSPPPPATSGTATDWIGTAAKLS